MISRGLIAVWLLAGCAAMAPPLAAGPLIATSKKPAVYCVAHDAATLSALKRGDRRVVVVVKSLQPGKPANASLVVTLVAADKTNHEVSRFAVHPLRAFTAQEKGKEHRFLVSLQDHAAKIEEGKPLCLEVGFSAGHGKLEAGSAEIEIELKQMGSDSN